MSSPPPPPQPFARAIPEGDDRERLVCVECGFVLYDNPKIVVGSVARWDDKILLCRRAINPRRGFWTLPAGYLELNESTRAGAESSRTSRCDVLGSLNRRMFATAAAPPPAPTQASAASANSGS